MLPNENNFKKRHVYRRINPELEARDKAKGRERHRRYYYENRGLILERAALRYKSLKNMLKGVYAINYSLIFS